MDFNHFCQFGQKSKPVKSTEPNKNAYEDLKKNKWTLIILVNLVKSQNLLKAQSLSTHVWIFKKMNGL